jgi:hypothetical protein
MRRLHPGSAAGRALTAQDHSLIASLTRRDLLLCATHLFDPARVAGCGVTWLNEGEANWSRAVTARCPQRTLFPDHLASPPRGAVWLAVASPASIARCMATRVALAPPRTHVELQHYVEIVGRWRRGTNVWRRITSPARGFRRLTSSQPQQGLWQLNPARQLNIVL